MYGLSCNSETSFQHLYFFIFQLVRLVLDGNGDYDVDGDYDDATGDRYCINLAFVLFFSDIWSSNFS